MRPRVSDPKLHESDYWEIPIRNFLPAAEQPAITAIVCTRLAQNTQLHDPNDFGGNGIVEVITADGTRVPFRQWCAFHKSHGLEWGYGGSGPHALAANVLGLLVPLKEAWRLAQRYKEDVIARLPRDGGGIMLTSVREWLEHTWALERADSVLMADELQRREFADAMRDMEQEESQG